MMQVFKGMHCYIADYFYAKQSIPGSRELWNSTEKNEAVRETVLFIWLFATLSHEMCCRELKSVLYTQNLFKKTTN